MTDISTLTSVSVLAGVYDDQAVSLARDYLQDFTGDYLLFRYSGSVYFLFTGSDFTYDDGVFTTGDSFKVTELQSVLVPQSPAEPYTDSFTGNISGQIIGVENGVAIESVDGLLSGTIERQPEPKPLVYYYITCSYDMDRAITVECAPDLSEMQPVVYTNLATFPRLIEGVSNHVFTTNFILCIFSACLLFGTVFKHISN